MYGCTGRRFCARTCGLVPTRTYHEQKNFHHGGHRGTQRNVPKNTKGGHLWPPSCGLSLAKRCLDALDVLCLPALGAFDHVKLHLLTFLQAAEATGLNGGEMHEDILPGGSLNEAISLGSIEPFHCTLLSHNLTPFASAQASNRPPGGGTCGQPGALPPWREKQGPSGPTAQCPAKGKGPRRRRPPVTGGEAREPQLCLR